MRAEHEVAEAVDATPPDHRAARIHSDAARVKELALCNFEGPAYKVFEDELCLQSMPILRGMLRKGTLARIALKRCQDRGIPFWVHPDDVTLLRSSGEARDEIVIDVMMRGLKTFKRKALVEGGWNPNHRGGRGASCLTSYYVGQCIWEFRRVYTTWAKRRVAWAEQHALYACPAQSAYEVPGMFGLLQTANFLSEPEAVVFTTNFEDILDEQPPETQAVVRMTVDGYSDTEIADALDLTHGAVRTRKYRFRNALYDAARDRRIWIPEQLHTKAGTRHRQQRGAA
ncbi:hypothetical protein [Streptomyces mirabilis]|uniref:hypothetical protein n=1 Tax=Streptomyces mirabilis TaxID=68239 RepID=UPI00225217AC|nr:hypothetical protein [Streptomyces mirabilis]MCX4430226.1 hypothetical protein [Streptomyces mirabilis]